MMDCDGWWLRTALHLLACLPPVRPGHTPLAALAPLSLGGKGQLRARSHRGVHLNRYPQSPSWERAGLAVVWLVGAGLRPAPAWVCVRGRLVGGAGSGPGIPCVLVSVSWAPRPLTLKRRGRWGGREGSPLRFWLVTGRGFCASGWTFSLLERRQDDGSTCRMN